MKSDVFPAAKISKEWFGEVFTAWTKPRFSNFWGEMTDVFLATEISVGGS